MTWFANTWDISTQNIVSPAFSQVVQQREEEQLQHFHVECSSTCLHTNLKTPAISCTLNKLNHIICTLNKTIKSGRQTERIFSPDPSLSLLASLLQPPPSPSASPFSPSSLSQHTSVILCNKLAVSRKVAAQRLPLLVRSFLSQGDVYSWAIYNNCGECTYMWLIIQYKPETIVEVQIDIIWCKR